MVLLPKLYQNLNPYINVGSKKKKQKQEYQKKTNNTGEREESISTNCLLIPKITEKV